MTVVSRIECRSPRDAENFDLGKSALTGSASIRTQPQSDGTVLVEFVEAGGDRFKIALNGAQVTSIITQLLVSHKAAFDLAGRSSELDASQKVLPMIHPDQMTIVSHTHEAGVHKRHPAFRVGEVYLGLDIPDLENFLKRALETFENPNGELG